MMDVALMLTVKTEVSSEVKTEDPDLLHPLGHNVCQT